MTRFNYDVVVVGGGPAGCMAAKYAANAGAATLIIEEDAKIGEPVQCAGLISKRALEESELKDGTSFINGEIKGAVVHSPSTELLLESPDQRAFAIRRNSFDQELANAAQRAGAEILLGNRVTKLEKQGDEPKLTITTATAKGTQELTAKVVIGADGVRSSVAQRAGLTVTRGFLNCVQIEGEYEIEDAFAEIFVGRGIAPGFFAWTIPLGTENRTRIGLCIDTHCSPHTNPLLFLKQNLSNHPVIAKKYRGTIVNRTAGKIPIPLDPRCRGRTHKTVKIDNDVGILLAGDAAAQIKPITGGGVYYGMKCGKIAGKIAAHASLTGDMKILHEYERRWRKEIGEEIAFGLKVHKLRCLMTDKDFDTIIQTLSRSDLLDRIKAAGDMDYPSIVFHEFLRNPCLIKLVARNILRYLYTK